MNTSLFALLVLFSSTMQAPKPTPQPSPPPSQSPVDVSKQDRMPLAQMEGIKARLVPAPGRRVRVELLNNDQLRLDIAFTDIHGNVQLQRQVLRQHGEIRVVLGYGRDFVAKLDLLGRADPFIIRIQPDGIQRTRTDPVSEKATGLSVSLTSFDASAQAVQELEKGRELGLKKKYDQATARLHKATELYPQYAEAFNELGVLYRMQNKLSEADSAFELAIRTDPNWVSPYINLAALQMVMNQPERLLATSNKLLELNPDLGAGYFFRAASDFAMGHSQAGMKYAHEADIRDHADTPQLHLLLARIYQSQGNSAEYAAQLRTYLKEAPDAANAAQIKAELGHLK